LYSCVPIFYYAFFRHRISDVKISEWVVNCIVAEYQTPVGEAVV
jgi:hypothetical protein